MSPVLSTNEGADWFWIALRLQPIHTRTPDPTPPPLALGDNGHPQIANSRQALPALTGNVPPLIVCE
jgi:hypothetical protein